MYLSRALNVDLEDGRLTPIDDSAYVLTLDFTIKMLNIHERSVMSTFFQGDVVHGLLYRILSQASTHPQFDSFSGFSV